MKKRGDRPVAPDERPSRSQKKRDSAALQKIAEDLTRLPPAALASFDMPEELADAIRAFQTMRDREAKRRQAQYLGRLMREHDTTALVEHYRAWKEDADALTQQQQALTGLRDRLAAGAATLEEALAQCPGCDEKRLEALVNQARHEYAMQQGKTPPLGAAPVGKAGRTLFRALRDGQSEGQGKG